MCGLACQYDLVMQRPPESSERSFPITSVPVNSWPSHAQNICLVQFNGLIWS